MSKFNDLANRILNESPEQTQDGNDYLHTQLVSFLSQRLAPRIVNGDVEIAVNLVNSLMEILSPAGRGSSLSLQDAKLKLQAAGREVKNADPAYAKAKRIKDQEEAENRGPGAGNKGAFGTRTND